MFGAVYDVTRRETFEDLASIWLNEVEMYSTVEDAAKMVVANKLDLVRYMNNISPQPHKRGLRLTANWDLLALFHGVAELILYIIVHSL